MNLKIRELRKKSHISQTELAERVGVSLRTVGAWERGETIPDAEQIWNCALALGCSPNDIYGWDDYRPKDGVRKDPYESELINYYRECTPEYQDSMLKTARASALISKDMAQHPADDAEVHDRRQAG